MKQVLLGDALELLLDHRGKTPKKLGADFTPTGVPVVSAQLVAHGVLDLAEARTVSAATFEKWMPVPLAEGDVLLTSEAPLGRVARVSNGEPLVLGQRLFALRGKRGVLDSRYLFYYLQTETAQGELFARSTGSTVVGIRQSALRMIPINLPDIHEQQAIAEVLGALDDKIAANTNLARTADGLASALFRQTVAGLEFSDQTFADVAYVSGGGTPKTSVAEYWGGDILWATPTDVTGLEGPYLFDTGRHITSLGLENCASRLYPSESILMTSRATIGAFALAEQPVAVNQGFIVVRARDDVLNLWLFHEMRDRTDEFLSHANGATFLELSRGRFKQLPVRVPEPAVARRFDGEARSLHNASARLFQENRTLAALRDTLLPQLMSGKLRVRDAERAVGEAL
ncbi:restriction endonuclease subunit S [Mumia sp. zg.B53]|uniref:restriction endonuclease subunit S n=1 Tax=Mumia sp. zg.B53 TaxID=2855449 RepID=UPI001C6E8B54|nr:restriction endonuclease subunit S [Mumia sp. zg.B53]MBW9214772.1 restriction endonuclease subunit S [Mumia sp. zg.B53]